MSDKWKVESVINALHMIMGALHILLDQSQLSPQGKDYYINRILRCFDLLDSLECMDEEEEKEGR